MAKGRKTGGRRPGSPNRHTAALKDIILQALAVVGGADYLVEQARKHPGQFMALLGRVLPLQVKQDGQEPMVPAVVNHIFEVSQPVSSGKVETAYVAGENASDT